MDFGGLRHGENSYGGYIQKGIRQMLQKDIHDNSSEEELKQDMRDLARADDDGFALAREEGSQLYHEQH
ncbi:MAG: hypothetical protein KGJ11_09000 [Candidatus Omnitrophica bacterium]|nr:hypothetical protein [Candidatus Omnitrophota bacterium]